MDNTQNIRYKEDKIKNELVAKWFRERYNYAETIQYTKN